MFTLITVLLVFVILLGDISTKAFGISLLCILMLGWLSYTQPIYDTHSDVVDTAHKQGS